ncbi:MAG: hypothetical protein F4X98_06615 [Gammaproteobacteria bacterium]|nr:hypothetical protein [Gammaproteobacteria bacterium]
MIQRVSVALEAGPVTHPISNDLGEPAGSVTARFGFSESPVSKWMARYRATGHVAPGQAGGRGC